MASLVANMALVVTGGLVRLTKSGLGCPTWPQCEGSSYVPHPEAGIHGLIEFGNRTLTFVLAAIAIGTFVAAWRALDGAGRPRRDLRWLAFATGLLIPIQAIIGGITVLTQLNPWIVALHLLASVVIIGLCVALVTKVYEVSPTAVSRLGDRLVKVAFALTMVTMVVGTSVTGAGPHSGDGGALRNGLSPELTAKIHAWIVWALVGVTVAALAVTRARLVAALLGTLLLQGLIGYVQYFTHLPVALVTLHLAGITLTTAVSTAAVLLVRHGQAPSSTVSRALAAQVAA
jgi:cytochrome c oxidase assembly protein subunit 15